MRIDERTTHVESKSPPPKKKHSRRAAVLSNLEQNLEQSHADEEAVAGLAKVRRARIRIHVRRVEARPDWLRRP